MAKKDKKEKKGKKGKESSEPTEQDQDEQLLAATELEPEPEEIQFTDTSYTSASFESLPPVTEEPKAKRKRGGKKKSQLTMESVTARPSEMFNWSEESLPVVEEEVKEKVLEEERVKKSKKKKKGKKEKPDVEKTPEFTKPKNWKKMSKKERDVWMEEKIQQWREEKEVEKQAILAGAKEKRLELAKQRNELMARQLAEQEIRRDLLQKTVSLFHKYEKQKMKLVISQQHQEEWQQYLRCDGLPDPRLVTQMNTYLHLWQMITTCDDSELDKRCNEALPMLEMLEVFVSNPREHSKLQMEGFTEVRLAMRAQLGATIAMASFYLLRDLEKNLKYEGIKLATYQRQFKGLRLELWVQIRLPTRKPKPVEPDPEPIELAYPAMKVALKLPKMLDGKHVCVRAARSSIDLLSERSRSYPLIHEMPDRYSDLFVFNVKELLNIQQLKAEQDAIRTAFYKDLREKVKAIEAFIKANVFLKNEKEKDDLDNLNMTEAPVMPDPREFIAESNEKAFMKYLKSCLTRTRAGELNLRKYRICGGVLNLDLLITPPQPKRMRNEVTVTTFLLPKALQPMKYQVQYRAPSPPPQGVTRTPEEIEAEMKRTEREYEKLALVLIDLPQDVMWTEPPVICQWQEPRKLWTSNYVNDYKFNEDKLTVQFRTGVLWPIGIGALRYGNMPFQGWDMKPDPKGSGVLITVTGVAVTVTWLLRGTTVRLKFIANATTPALKNHYNKKYPIKRMLEIMREAACDFFPDFDGHSHVEGSCPKEWSAERHNYHAMAFMSRSHNFQWSRWNAAAGWRNIVMQVREAVDTKREGKFQLLYVTPNHATILKNNEMTQEFTYEPMPGLSFYPDLFTLNMSYGSVDARRATFNMNFKLVETVFEFLQELKLSSFS